MNVTMSGDYVKGRAETCGELGRAALPTGLLILRGGPLRVRTSGVGC
ncbi:hypothetical protein OHA04_19815 [Streptomyces sp. NBC_01590]